MRKEKLKPIEMFVESNIRWRLRDYCGFEDIEHEVETCMKYIVKNNHMQDLIKALSKDTDDNHNPFDADKDEFAALVHDFIGDEFVQCNNCEKHIMRDHAERDDFGNWYCNDDCIHELELAVQSDNDFHNTYKK